MPSRIASLFRNLLGKNTVEQALDAELQSSAELLTAEKMKDGLSPSAARREALMELGGVEQVKEEVGDVRLGRRLESLAKAVGKSRRSVVTYLDELRQRRVCSIHAAVNQHVGGQIEICDAFWPYERVQPSPSTEALPAFIEQTQRLLAARRCIGITFAEADARLAASLFDRHIPIEEVEHAVLLGCARKYVTLINRQRGELIASFSYFANVIEAVRELKMPAEYWRHLQTRVARLEQQWTQIKAASTSTTTASIPG